MLKNYLKTAWRSLLKNKTSSVINISGLAVGMAVAIIIGLWIWDEISFDRSNKNYSHIAQVMQNQDINGERTTWRGVPYPLADALRSNFKDDFKCVTLINWANSILSYNNKPLSKNGIYVESKAQEMLDLKMLKGSIKGLEQPDALFISRSLAKAVFGNEEPINKIITVEQVPAKIAGVYEDMPANSSFADINFIAPWQLKLTIVPGIKTMENPWGNNGFQVMVQLADNTDMKTVSEKIKYVKLNNIREQEKIAKPLLFLHPMNKWHLYSDFKNGVNVGGKIEFVWLFGIIGIFVLLLACINFMNLSTARSEKRAREVGIRKAVGSLRRQLIAQFLCESVMVAVLASVVALLIAYLSLPFFNTIADKHLTIPFSNSYFVILVAGFAIFTGIIAGSYPAFYLSHFNPVKVLKGTFAVGRFSSLPRKILVVLQFSVSIILIICTIVVLKQIQFAKERSVGYDRSGLLMVSMHMYDVRGHFEAIRNDLKNTGAILEIAESGNPITAVYNSNGGMNWRGKVPGTSVDFPMNAVSVDYGKTVRWKIVQGRDFSRSFPSDSAAFILNESAVKFMGLKNPVGEQVSFDDGVAFTVVGVVKDFVMESPYNPVRPSMFRMVRRNNGGMLNLKLNPAIPVHEAVQKAEAVFKKYNPDQPFEYKFADEEYAKKFNDEERIGNLASLFAILAIFISCLGLFGLSAFVAESRIKEIGVRKILGASVFNITKLLSLDFVKLVMIAIAIATPVAWYAMNKWLLNYTYRISIGWMIFFVAGLSAIVIALMTVSFQSIKAAVANPVKSLRNE